jgi:hypothetical protein
MMPTTPTKAWEKNWGTAEDLVLELIFSMKKLTPGANAPAEYVKLQVWPHFKHRKLPNDHT